MIGKLRTLGFQPEVTRLLIQSMAAALHAVHFVHKSFELADLGRTGRLVILLIEFRRDACELTSVLHRRRTAAPRVSDVQFVGTVQPSVLNLFRKFFPCRFQHRAGFEIVFFFVAIGDALINVPLPTTKVFPFPQQIKTTLLK